MSLLAVSAMSFPEWSPALFQLDLGFLGLGKFPIRWYALGYIAGLLIAWRYALALIERPKMWGGEAPTTREGIDDLLFWATLGVILGGRLGYVFFYQIPFQWDAIERDPMSLLRIWEGGMSFHGGMAGVALAVTYVARKHKLKLLSIADIGGVTAGFGIFFVRIANFINAELYGRPVSPDHESWGMVFPEGRVPGSTPPAYNWNTGEWVYNGSEVARYPSQVYEAVLEGLIPVIVTAILVWRFRALQRPGLIAGLFLLMYGVGRSIAEQFREPDSFTWGVMPDWLTMGQLLSMPMWLGGLYLVWSALSKPRVSATS
ncbi:prolipoprotein diacylglyceryl transferase [Hyphomonas sp. FCG-A18]|uniref:prolipoprotein diacylglyceryl transferase n=1 Tax=Hyphomonas sp. FCG-A18 TaxID=3080019 RepID=UPI002B31630A|nr:prolipoprotein diacylglyceryl transferase [Hyphomonas sp. FCG-A18]